MGILFLSEAAAADRNMHCSISINSYAVRGLQQVAVELPLYFPPVSEYPVISFKENIGYIDMNSQINQIT